jgi:hypothetical protein
MYERASRVRVAQSHQPATVRIHDHRLAKKSAGGVPIPSRSPSRERRRCCGRVHGRRISSPSGRDWWCRVSRLRSAPRAARGRHARAPQASPVFTQIAGIQAACPRRGYCKSLAAARSSVGAERGTAQGARWRARRRGSCCSDGRGCHVEPFSYVWDGRRFGPGTGDRLWEEAVRQRRLRRDTRGDVPDQPEGGVQRHLQSAEWLQRLRLGHGPHGSRRRQRFFQRHRRPTAPAPAGR